MCDHHSIRWGVRSDDGTTYGVTPNSREKAERECMLLRQPDEDGYAEPSAWVAEERVCSWIGTRLHEPPKGVTWRP